jgi:hypothetical protein
MDFFNNANINGELLTAIAFKLYDFEVIKWTLNLNQNTNHFY